jgi:hypothetical protein
MGASMPAPVALFADWPDRRSPRTSRHRGGGAAGP